MGVLPPKPSGFSPKDADAAAATPTALLSYTRMSSSVALGGNDNIKSSGGGGANTAHIGYSDRHRVYRSNPDAAVLSGAIGRLPLDIQVAFRRKVLAIFALQLFFVTVVVAAFEWIPSLQDAWKSVLDGQNQVIAIPSIATLVFLLALYFVRNKFPWNWVCLFLFSAALCFLYASLGVIFETSVGVINCGAIFVWTLVMIALSGVRLSANDGDTKLLPTLAMGVAGYVVVAAGVSVLYAIFQDDFVTRDGLIGTLIFQLVMSLWFGHDAKAMFRAMTPDEYMHGVIYFYTDIMLLLVIMAIGFLIGEGGGTSGPIEPLYFGTAIDVGQIRDADEEA